MAVRIIDVSRKEVERWLSAGTLDIAKNDRYYHVNGNDDYYLVSLSAVFAARWDAIWVPSVIETTSSVKKLEDWTRALDEEILAELFGKMVCHCFEVWHLVDEFDEYDFDKILYGVVAATLDDVLAIEVYERACKELETSPDSPESVDVLEYVSAFERAYDIVRDLCSFYPVTTYKRRKTDFALDFVSALSELRLAGCVEDA